MAADERRAGLLEVIRRRSFATLPDLAMELGVSESTIRRDLDFFETSGTAKRTHGGVFYTGPSPTLQHFELRQNQHWRQKRQIAEAASRLIQDGETVLLDGGSTTYELARLLVGRPLQMVTNSLPVANLFTSSDSTDLVLIGGYLHGRTGVFVGPFANQMLRNLNVQRAFLSVAGATEKGFYNSNLLLVETERQMMTSADEVIILADSTKFGRSSLSRLAELDSVHTVVVNDGIDDSWHTRLSEAGVHVVIAPSLSSELTDSESTENNEPADAGLQTPTSHTVS